MISQAAHNTLQLLDDNPGTGNEPVGEAIRAELIEAGFAEMTYEALTITEAGRMFVRRGQSYGEPAPNAPDDPVQPPDHPHPQEKTSEADAPEVVSDKPSEPQD